MAEPEWPTRDTGGADAWPGATWTGHADAVKGTTWREAGKWRAHRLVGPG